MLSRKRILARKAGSDTSAVVVDAVKPQVQRHGLYGLTTTKHLMKHNFSSMFNWRGVVTPSESVS